LYGRIELTSWSLGRFVLKGRVDRIAKIEGKRISLSTIEATLKTSPLVSDARAIVANGARQRIAAFIVPSEQGRWHLTSGGKPALNRVLREQLRRWIDPIGLPRVWRYLDALPANTHGKTTVAGASRLAGKANSRADKAAGAAARKRCRPRCLRAESPAQSALL
jgi:acyl-coenzyme A synthetase/AMP-(fatty) acid ligase